MPEDLKVQKRAYTRLFQSLYRRWKPEKLENVDNLLQKYEGQWSEALENAMRLYAFPHPREVWRCAFEAMYRHFNPEKLQKIDEILDKYEDSEAVLFRALCDKYIPTLTAEDALLELWPAESAGASRASPPAPGKPAQDAGAAEPRKAQRSPRKRSKSHGAGRSSEKHAGDRPKIVLRAAEMVLTLRGGGKRARTPWSTTDGMNKEDKLQELSSDILAKVLLLKTPVYTCDASKACVQNVQAVMDAIESRGKNLVADLLNALGVPALQKIRDGLGVTNGELKTVLFAKSIFNDDFQNALFMNTVSKTITDTMTSVARIALVASYTENSAVVWRSFERDVNEVLLRKVAAAAAGAAAPPNNGLGF